MLRQAWSELRLHPGRFVAVLSAIAISIAFLTVSQVFVQTESDALGKTQVAYSSNADFVVESKSQRSAPGSTSAQAPKTTPSKLAEEIKKVPGVTAVDLVESRNDAIHLPNGTTSYQAVITLPKDSQLGWVKIAEGSLPTSKSEIALNKTLKKKYSLKLGDEIGMGFGNDTPKLKISGFTNEPSGMGTFIAYLSPDSISDTSQSSLSGISIIAKSTDTDQAVKATNAKLKELGLDSRMEAKTSKQLQTDTLNQMTKDVDVPKYILGVFAAIALLVGAIIIANTFQILVAQRRRQVGLLRAVGSSSGQVFRRFLAEAVLLGIIGTILGLLLGTTISALASWLWTGSIVYGLSIPWGPITGIFVAGVIITTISSLAPIRSALKVTPLEALHPASTVEERRKASIARIIICSLFALLGAGALAGSFAIKAKSLDTALPIVGLAIAGSALLSVAILVGAQLYVPPLLKLLGALFCHTPTSKLSVKNSVRNPKRAGATALALILAVGLISTIQVAAATARRTSNEVLDQRYPLDITMTLHDFSSSATDQSDTHGAFSDQELKDVQAMSNVQSAVLVKSTPQNISFSAGKTGTSANIVEFDPALRSVSSGPLAVSDDEILMNPTIIDEQKLEVGKAYDVSFHNFMSPTSSEIKTIKLTVKSANAAENPIVSPTTFAKISDSTAKNYMVLKLKDRGEAIDTMEKLMTGVLGKHQMNAQMGGGALFKGIISTIINVLLAIVTGLLAVAAVIALIGVGNTLGLSVIERTREFAMLRAVGLQASGLRVLLLVEALLLALVGTIVGLAMGVFFGFIGSKSVLRAMGLKQYYFAMDWRYTVGTVLLATIMGALASVIPGRKAAKATPVEALADVG